MRVIEVEKINILKQHLPLVVAIILIGVFLLSVYNRILPYEQDQVGKAAQIIYLIDSSNEWSPLASANIYRNFELSNYYLLTTNIYKIFSGDIFTFMNGMSVVFGIIFFLTTAKLLNRVAEAPYLLSCFIFVSMPVVAITFIYGNEVAIALSLFVLSMLLANLSFRGNDYFALLLLCLATYTRIDVVLMLPFWFAWTTYYSCPTETLNGKGIRLIKQVILYGLFCFGYWLLFLRLLPIDAYSFTYNTNIKLLIGYMTYPFNLGIVIWGGLAILKLLYTNWKEGSIYLLLLLPFLFYLPNLSTPKYIIAFSLMLTFPILLQWKQSNKYIRITLLLTVGFWWIVGITPFGVFAFQEGSYWYLPTADGPMPTGAYLNFYKNVRDGLYQERYIAEFDGVEDIFNYFEEQEAVIPILGYFNLQFYDYELINRQLWNMETNTKMYPWARFDFILEQHDLYVMMDRSYLNLGTLTSQAQVQVRDWLARGKVKYIATTDELFPNVILIGEAVEDGNEIALGQRILFMNDYYNAQRTLSSSKFVPAYRSLCWLEMSLGAEHKSETAILYQDEMYYALAEDAEGCIIYNTMMPFVYYQEEDPKGY